MSWRHHTREARATGIEDALRQQRERLARLANAKTGFRVAALFVQSGGCYSKIEWVDSWPQERDARNYDGNLPVVAHPPCQLWGNLAAVNWARWGGEHNRPGNDAGCFAAAVKAVRRCGGVLEHPANSKAFGTHGITPPSTMGWQRVICGGWVCEVWQSAYGHRANKKTWLYYFGENPPTELKWDRIIGTHQVGQACRQGIRETEPWRNKQTLTKREANATPELFRDALLSIAIQANVNTTDHSAPVNGRSCPRCAGQLRMDGAHEWCESVTGNCGYRSESSSG